LMNVLDSLEANPDRCPLAEEAGDLGVELREQLYRRRRNVHRSCSQSPAIRSTSSASGTGAQDRLTGADI